MMYVCCLASYGLSIRVSCEHTQTVLIFVQIQTWPLEPRKPVLKPEIAGIATHSDTVVCAQFFSSDLVMYSLSVEYRLIGC